jgi:hypothetical protein
MSRCAARPLRHLESVQYSMHYKSVLVRCSGSHHRTCAVARLRWAYAVMVQITQHAVKCQLRPTVAHAVCLPQVPRLAEFVVRGSGSATNILLYCLAQVPPLDGFV